MPDKSATAPAYVATLTPYPIHHPVMRQVRLSGRQVDALKRQVALVIDGTSRQTPCTQAELAIQDATREALGREVCAALWRDRNEGDLFVMCGGSFVAVASITVAPAQREERAA